MSGSLLAQEVEQSATEEKQDQAESDASGALPNHSENSLHGLPRTFVQDEFHIWTSPFRGRSYSSRGFAKYVVPFTLITGALIATDHRTSQLLPNTSSQDVWSGRVSRVGAPYTVAGMAGTAYVIGKLTRNRKAREAGLLGLEAIAHTQIATEVLKEVTQRERPLDFQANNGGGLAFGSGGNSFPSGHASGSFALATVFAYEYGDEHPWVPYASYGLASVVAASRLSAQQHWVSDIFVGSTLGFLIGRFVYKTHHDPSVDGEVPTRADRRIPSFGISAHGATVAWNW